MPEELNAIWASFPGWEMKDAFNVLWYWDYISINPLENKDSLAMYAGMSV